MSEEEKKPPWLEYADHAPMAKPPLRERRKLLGGFGWSLLAFTPLAAMLAGGERMGTKQWLLAILCIGGWVGLPLLICWWLDERRVLLGLLLGALTCAGVCALLFAICGRTWVG